MFSILNISDEEKDRRRELTDFAVKLMLLAAGVALIVELGYYFLVISPEPPISRLELPLQLSVTITALGLLAIMLGVNRLKVVPYWVASTIFLLALTFLALFSDTPQEVINGRSTMFLLAPILLSGVLIHSYATFVFTSFMIFLVAAYARVTPGTYLNPPNIIFFLSVCWVGVAGSKESREIYLSASPRSSAKQYNSLCTTGRLYTYR